MASQTQSTTCSCADDSDATVAPDEEPPPIQGLTGENEGKIIEDTPVETISDNSMPCSPSILHPPETTNIQKENRDFVSCSSEEEVLSQEYPPPLPRAPAIDSREAAAGNGGAATQQPHSTPLHQIENDQTTLLSEVERVLDNYGDILPVGFVKDASAQLHELEKKLKLVSEAHQAERKELVVHHSQLSQGRGFSQGTGGEGGASDETDSLRAKLVSLSARQKQLLQCFSKQKEITSKVAILAEREVKAKKTVTVEPLNHKSNPVQVILPNLVKHLFSRVAHNLQPHPPPLSNSQLHPPSSQPCPMPSNLQPHPQPHMQTDSLDQLPQSRLVGQTSSNQDASSSVSLGHPRVGPAPSQDTRQATQDTHQDATIKTMESLPLSQLTQPVPLDTLIQYNILQPGPRTLTCTILGCEFVGSLARDGTIEEALNPSSPSPLKGRSSAGHHQLPQQWVKSCWARLGHPHKKVFRKQAYNMIAHDGKTLSQHCEQYSRKQVSTFLSHKKATRKSSTEAVNRIETTASALSKVVNISQQVKVVSNNPTASKDASQSQPVTPLAQPMQSLFDLNSLLISGEVVLVSDDFQSLHLPLCDSFWEEKEEGSVFLLQELESNLEW